MRSASDPLVPEPDGFLALDAGVWLWDGPCSPRTQSPASHLGRPARDGRRRRLHRKGRHPLPRASVEEDDFPRVFEFISGLSEKSFFPPISQLGTALRRARRRALPHRLPTRGRLGGRLRRRRRGERIACLGRVSLADPAECPDEAEFGVVVADRDQRRGLATRMMARLEDEALRLGAKAIFGIVPAATTA